MILLDKSKYSKVLKPLMNVTINNLFARSVVEEKVNGFVYVDNTEDPGTFYIIHPYGMSLLFGETDNDIFNSKFLDHAFNTFKIRDKYEWLQAFPESWNKKISILFGDNLIKSKDNPGNFKSNKIEENTRVNFKFNKIKYLDFRNKNNNKNFTILRTDKEMFENMQGSVVAKHFWNNSEDFFNRGVGFSLIYEDILASTAFSAFIQDNKLELGIETLEIYRGKGFALFTCSSLIDYCLDNDYEPIWSCRLENTGSFILAQKLGFEPTVYIPFYRLIG
jgi:RimJ/RimL family protein N-acetyltransferase